MPGMWARPLVSEFALKSGRPSRRTRIPTSGIGFPWLSRMLTSRVESCCVEPAQGKPKAESRRVNRIWVHKLSRRMSIDLAGVCAEFGSIVGFERDLREKEKQVDHQQTVLQERLQTIENKRVS